MMQSRLYILGGSILLANLFLSACTDFMAQWTTTEARQCYEATLKGAENVTPQDLRVCDNALVSRILSTTERAYTFNNRGVLYLYRGEFDYAIRDFESALSFKTNYALAFNNRGWSYVQQGFFDLAIQDFNRAINIETSYEWPEDKQAWAYRNRGWVAYKRGQFEQAIIDYDNALDRDSRSAVI